MQKMIIMISNNISNCIIWQFQIYWFWAGLYYTFIKACISKYTVICTDYMSLQCRYGQYIINCTNRWVSIQKYKDLHT